MTHSYNIAWYLLSAFFIFFVGCSEIKNPSFKSGIGSRGCGASSCHVSSPLGEYPPTGGNHGIHAASDTDIACSQCHGDYTLNPLHKNGIVDRASVMTGRSIQGGVVVFDQSLNPTGTWNVTTQTCSGLGCHTQAPWYAPGPGNCTFCHSPGLLIDPGSNGQHQRHANIYNCEVCHEGYGSGATHKNGTVDTKKDGIAIVRFSAPFSGAYDKMSRTCSSLSCHRDVSWDSTLANSCDLCHFAGSSFDPYPEGAHENM